MALWRGLARSLVPRTSACLAPFACDSFQNRLKRTEVHHNSVAFLHSSRLSSIQMRPPTDLERRISVRALSTQQQQQGSSFRDKIPLLGGLASGAVLLAGKSKWILGALKLTKLSTLGSMVLSSVAYSYFFGWPYAVGMVGLLLVHESGHALTMHKLGIATGPMVFIPFVGAVVAMKDAPRDVYTEAIVALGGPVLGSAGALALAVGGVATGSQLLHALADFGFMINLFNLLPIGWLDGGRVAGAISRWTLVGGMGIGGALAWYGIVSNPIFYLVLLTGAFSTFQRFWYEADPSYFTINNYQRTTLTVSYVGLIVALVIAMAWNGAMKKSPEQLELEKRMRVQSSQW